jgi:uncharacterized membrane protein YkvA (DUF1232 family)
MKKGEPDSVRVALVSRYRAEGVRDTAEFSPARAFGRDVVARHIAGRDPRVPWSTKLAAMAVAAYALSQLDLRRSCDRPARHPARR